MIKRLRKRLRSWLKERFRDEILSEYRFTAYYKGNTLIDASFLQMVQYDMAFGEGKGPAIYPGSWIQHRMTLTEMRFYRLPGGRG